MSFDTLSELFDLRLRDQLSGIRGVHPDSVTGRKVLEAASRSFEALIHQIELDLENRESRLNAELVAAGVERDFLRRQVEAASACSREANRSKRPGLIAAALIGLGSIFGSVVTGSAEGLASAVAGHQIEGTSAEDYSKECIELAESIISGGPVRRPLPAPAGWYPNPDQGSRGHFPVRWWDGERWTDYVQQLAEEGQDPDSPTISPSTTVHQMLGDLTLYERARYENLIAVGPRPPPRVPFTRRGTAAGRS
jgi:hypothetical protein